MAIGSGFFPWIKVFQSKEIFLGSPTDVVLDATFTGSYGGKDIGFALSVDATNWENIVPGVKHAFTNTGSALYLKAVSEDGGGGSITYYEIEYTVQR